ncbi:MAG: hypothetical protein KGH57_01905 [Candidatus Micrarchaeota archaeon]|nr:hypothetical protein [Candidatus Micrarchaeota archaeon]
MPRFIFGSRIAERESDLDELALDVNVTPVSLVTGEAARTRARIEMELEAKALVEIEPSDAVIRRILQPKPDSVGGSRRYLDNLIKKIRREGATSLKLDEKSGFKEELGVYAETMRPKEAVAFSKFLERSGR